MTFEEKTMHLAISIGAIETVRYEEEKEGPKSARSRSLSNLVDNAERVISFYKMNDWSAEKLDKASKCLAYYERKVQQAFNPKPLPVRGEKGRFMAQGAV